MPRKNTNKQQLNVLMPKEVYEQLKRLAEADERSISNYVIKLVKDKVEYESTNKNRTS